MLHNPTLGVPSELMPKSIQFRDLGTVVDEIHGLFEEWEHSEASLLPIDEFSLQVMKLAVHEWVANLVQHADFGDRAPLIQVGIQPGEERVHCMIEDNSQGFDFDLQLVEQRESMETVVPPDRGRGLLMMIACTENLRYHQPSVDAQTGRPCHRLEFSISAFRKPWLDIPF